jgi:hypothetical protein
MSAEWAFRLVNEAPKVKTTITNLAVSAAIFNYSTESRISSIQHLQAAMRGNTFKQKVIISE